MKKYVVYPGYIDNKNDNETHFIDYPTLIRLYNVPPNECVCMTGHMSDRGKNIEGLIKLYPDYYGHYEIKNQK